MRRTYKYRLLGNRITFTNAEKWRSLCQRLYNVALEQRRMLYRNGNHTTCFAQQKQLPELKREFTDYQYVDAQTLQDVLERLNSAYESFFRRIKKNEKVGLPRFKSKDRYNSFTLKQTSWKLNGKYLTIRNMGKFKLRLSRPIEGQIKTLTIHKEPSNHWYVLFSCDNIPIPKLKHSKRVIGIDVGLTSFCVDSDGKHTDNPRYAQHAQRQLKIRQRIMSRRTKNSQGKKEAQLLVAKTYERITNQHNDFLHKTSNYYIKNYKTICIEDLNINGLVRNHHLAKSISEASWGKFFELLNYKAEETGRLVIKVPRFEPTSKTCSQCGAINQELKLSDRQWVCKSCGVLHDRDYNAAKNIKRVGQTQQTPTYENTQCVVCESQQLESVKKSIPSLNRSITIKETNEKLRYV